MLLRSGAVTGSGVLGPEQKALFEEAARLVFLHWTALCLAVENEWGGTNSREKADQLFADVLDWFSRRKNPDIDDLEEELDDAITQDFNVQAEDNSPYEVAKVLVAAFQELTQGNMATLTRLRQLPPPAKSQKVTMDRDGTMMEEGESSISSDDENGDASMDDAEGSSRVPAGVQLEPAAPRQQVVDEEGFTLVQSKRKGKK